MEKLVLLAVGVSLLLAGCTTQANPSVTPQPLVGNDSSPPAITGVVSSVVPSISPNQVLFKEREGWGPCPGPFDSCSQLTVLLYSGELILEGSSNSTSQLTPIQVEAVIGKIRSTGILEKECKFNPVMDYWAGYTINLDGKTKKVTFPGCDDELGEIKALIPTPTPSPNPRQGGE